jgi:Peptidase M50B-like
VEVLTEIWRRAVTEQPVPSPVLVTLVAAVAAALVVAPATWPYVRQLVTISHEGGHAFGALLTGRRLAGIRLHSDTSGVTVSHGRPRGPGMVVMLASGYLAPAVAGLGAAALLAAGHALGLLWLLVAWLSVMLLKIRNAYGFVVLLGCGAAVALASWYLSAQTVSALAYLLTWVLLIAAPKPLLELVAQRRRRAASASDVDQLARLTRVPGAVWLTGFLLLNCAGLLLGVVLLLPPAGAVLADLAAAAS